MHRRSTPVRRAASGTFSIALVAVLLAGAPSVAVAADTSPGPGAPSVDTTTIAETIGGWPGTRAEPAGLYSFPVSPGIFRWMHKVPETWTKTAPDSVELTFYAAQPRTTVTMFDHAAGVGEVRSEMSLLDVDGTMVAIVLDWFADTDPALVNEARAVIESIVAEPTASSPRLVFRLMEGWDSG